MLPFFIAKRLTFGADGSRSVKTMTRIAIFSVALSMAVMIVSTSVLSGFKTKLKEKISGFNAHIRITNFDANNSFDVFNAEPVRNDYDFFDSIAALREVKSIKEYACKGGIIKAGNDIQGVILKGVGNDFDREFFSRYLVDGELFDMDSAVSDKALVSRTLSQLLNLKTGDRFTVYFVQDKVRIRRFTVSGLYDTHFEEMDKTFVICDIRQIRQLNGWENNQASGMEIMLHNIDDTDIAFKKIDEIAGYLTFDDGAMLDVTTLRDNFPHIFNWLDIIDMNVLVVLIIMIAVAGFNMISSLLIMLLEKISMTGILKSLGMTNSNIRKIFVYRASFIVIRGLAYGNIVGLTLCLLQQYFGIVKLNPETYFFTTAPVSINPFTVIILNSCSFLFITLIQIIPTFVITKISPDKIMRIN
jgi:lipoprotein-releasing system permease protein